MHREGPIPIHTHTCTHACSSTETCTCTHGLQTHSWLALSRAVLKGKNKNRVRNTIRNECSRAGFLGLLYFKGWRLVAVDGWRLVAFGGWHLVAVCGWQLAVGSGLRLVAIGGWRLAVPGGCPLGLSLTKKKKVWVLKNSPGTRRGTLVCTGAGTCTAPDLAARRTPSPAPAAAAGAP